jgi:hypothetical protein
VARADRDRESFGVARQFRNMILYAKAQKTNVSMSIELQVLPSADVQKTKVMPREMPDNFRFDRLTKTERVCCTNSNLP